MVICPLLSYFHLGVRVFFTPCTRDNMGKEYTAHSIECIVRGVLFLGVFVRTVRAVAVQGMQHGASRQNE